MQGRSSFIYQPNLINLLPRQIIIFKKSTGPEAIKRFFILNSTEHENYPAHNVKKLLAF